MLPLCQLQNADFVATSALAVPLRNHDGSILGVCVLLNKGSGPFSEFDEHMVQLECQVHTLISFPETKTILRQTGTDSDEVFTASDSYGEDCNS